MSEICRKYPPVQKPKPYRMTGGEPGYDGEPPSFEKVKDPDGKGKRMAETSNQNNNCDRVIYLKTHGRITDRQFQAAQRLEQDWTDGKIDPRASTVIVAACSNSTPQLPNDFKKDAMDRHAEAMAVLGELGPMVEKVVIENKSPEKASAELGWHVKYGHGVLWAGLHILADHYRIDLVNRHGGKIRAWRMEAAASLKLQGGDNSRTSD